jgi:hypothetical protein
LDAATAKAKEKINETETQEMTKIAMRQKQHNQCPSAFRPETRGIEEAFCLKVLSECPVIGQFVSQIRSRFRQYPIGHEAAECHWERRRHFGDVRVRLLHGRT